MLVQRVGSDVGNSGQSCSLLSSGSLLGLSPDPGFPEEAPHSLFLQEGHLQALQVQEPAQLQEPPARKEKAYDFGHRQNSQAFWSLSLP